MEKEETVSTIFRMPKTMRDRFEQIATERHVDLTVLLIEACQEYIENHDHPDRLKEKIRQALRDDPMLVSEAVQIYAARKLQK